MGIYLDYNATTPIDTEVADAMLPYLTEHFGNPSSSHSYGQRTKAAVENARQQIASLINCKPSEIVFTSGGTEANNYAIKGLAYANKYKGNHIITSVIEHPAIIEVCKYLETKGFRVSYIPVDEYGLVKLDVLQSDICSDTILVTIMHANNEIGTIQPLKEISQICKQNNIIFHTDAAQSVGKYLVDVEELGVDLLSIAGHKLYAPKGVGALYVREGILLEKFMHGADHENNQRAGTENILEVVGLGKACEISKRDFEKNFRYMKSLRDLFYNKIINDISNVKLNGHLEHRLPNTLNISFKNVPANILLAELEKYDIAASAGAACHTDSVKLSSTLLAIDLSSEFAMGTIRFSVGRHTKEDDIRYVIDILVKLVSKLRA